MTRTQGISAGQPINPLDAADRVQGRTATNASSKVEAAGSEYAVTTLSGTGSLLAASAANGDDVRTDKVAALKTAIDNGTYHVSAAAVADKIIGSLLG